MTKKGSAYKELVPNSRVSDSYSSVQSRAIYCKSRELRYTPDFLSRLVTSSDPTQPVGA